ncbi:MAG TPA: hypothetical protein VF533_04935 [Solirubrobacteraceae bacterium]|jgi:uncharacterized BrkB/YihY/UPF0761 family membrane protein
MADTRLTRRQREQRAYVSGLVAAGGALATVVTLLLAVFTSLSVLIVLLCAIVTVVAGLMFQRSVSR